MLVTNHHGISLEEVKSVIAMLLSNEYLIGGFRTPRRGPIYTSIPITHISTTKTRWCWAGLVLGLILNNIKSGLSLVILLIWRMASLTHILVLNRIKYTKIILWEGRIFQDVSLKAQSGLQFFREFFYCL